MKPNFFIMKHLFCLLLIFTTAFSSQARERIDLQNFQHLSLAAGIEVVLVPEEGISPYLLIIKGEREHLIIEEEGDLLSLMREDEQSFFSKDVEVKVELHGSVPHSISVSSGSELESSRVLEAENLVLQVRSGAHVQLSVKLAALEVSVSSGAGIALRGEVGKMTLNVSSGAAFKGKHLQVETAAIKASSGAEAAVWATKELSAEVRSGAALSYQKEPGLTVNLDVSDSASAKVF